MDAGNAYARQDSKELYARQFNVRANTLDEVSNIRGPEFFYALQLRKMGASVLAIRDFVNVVPDVGAAYGVLPGVLKNAPYLSMDSALEVLMDGARSGLSPRESVDLLVAGDADDRPRDAEGHFKQTSLKAIPVSQLRRGESSKVSNLLVGAYCDDPFVRRRELVDKLQQNH